MSRNAGKGDNLRPTNLKKYSDNWDRIKWNSKEDKENGLQQVPVVQQGEDPQTTTEISSPVRQDT